MIVSRVLTCAAVPPAEIPGPAPRPAAILQDCTHDTLRIAEMEDGLCLSDQIDGIVLHHAHKVNQAAISLVRRGHCSHVPIVWVGTGAFGAKVDQGVTVHVFHG